MYNKHGQNVETFKLENTIVLEPIVTIATEMVVMTMYKIMAKKKYFMPFLTSCSSIKAFCL